MSEPLNWWIPKITSFMGHRVCVFPRRWFSGCRAQHRHRPGQSDGPPGQENHLCLDQSGPGREEPVQPQQGETDVQSHRATYMFTACSHLRCSALRGQQGELTDYSRWLPEVIFGSKWIDATCFIWCTLKSVMCSCSFIDSTDYWRQAVPNEGSRIFCCGYWQR